MLFYFVIFFEVRFLIFDIEGVTTRGRRRGELVDEYVSYRVKK